MAAIPRCEVCALRSRIDRSDEASARIGSCVCHAGHLVVRPLSSRDGRSCAGRHDVALCGPGIEITAIDGGSHEIREQVVDLVRGKECDQLSVVPVAGRYRQPRENPKRVVLEITITRVLGNA